MSYIDQCGKPLSTSSAYKSFLGPFSRIYDASQLRISLGRQSVFRGSLRKKNDCSPSRVGLRKATLEFVFLILWMNEVHLCIETKILNEFWTEFWIKVSKPVGLALNRINCNIIRSFVTPCNTLNQKYRLRINNSFNSNKNSLDEK